jgi:hypothetical protein
MSELGGFGRSVERRVSRGESVGGSRPPAGWGAGREQVEGEVSKGTPSPDPEGTPTRQLSGVISTNSPAGLARSRRMFFGSVGDAAGVDAVGDADVAGVGIARGLGFEVMEDGAEGVGGGDGVVRGEGLVEEPLAEGAGADGEGAIAAEGLGGNPHECASADGGEGDAALGDAEEGVEAGGAAGFGWGMHGNTLQFEVSHWGGGVLRVSGP